MQIFLMYGLDWRGTFVLNNFLNTKKTTFSLLTVENHVKLAWEVHLTTRENQEARARRNFL